MKHITTLTLLVLSTLCSRADAFQINSKEKSNPVVITAIEVEEDVTAIAYQEFRVSYKFKDRNRIIRFQTDGAYIDHREKKISPFEYKSGSFSLFNSTGRALNSVHNLMTEQQFKDLALLGSVASKDCPIEIKFERDTFKLLSVVGTCDPQD